jgi:hypothetical protein
VNKNLRAPDSVIEPMKQLNLRSVPVVENLSAGEFRESYLAPKLPVVIKDMADSWPALKKWTPEYFAEQY